MLDVGDRYGSAKIIATEKYEKILAAQAERRTQHNTSGSLRWAERFGTLLGKNPAAYSGSDRSGAWPVKA